MSFEWPFLLLGLTLVPLAAGGYVLLQRRRMKYAARFTNVELLSSVVERSPGWRRHLPPAFLLLALAALLVGLARPHASVAVPREETSVVLAIDTSRSMQAIDVAPDRLTAAQAAAGAFLNQVPPEFRVGVVAFSSEAQVLIPPSSDRIAVREVVEELRADGGTAIGDAIVRAVELAAFAGENRLASDGDSKPFAVLLLSDGEPSDDTLDPREAVRIAQAAGIPVYTVALGTSEGTIEVPGTFGGFETIPVPPDHETLSSIAAGTGGEFFRAPSDDALRAVYEGLGAKLGFTEEERELTFAFAAGGLLFMLVGGGLSALWFNRFP